jgi:transporter family protein
VAIFARLGLASVDTTLATALRSAVMTALLCAAALWTGSFRSLTHGDGLDARAWGFIALAGISGAASWLAYFAALKLGPAGPVSALDRLSLPLVFMLGALLLGEKPGWPGWLGLVLTLAGIGLIALDATARR